MRQWVREFPKKEGWYWFYGFQFGRIECGDAVEPQLLTVKVRKCSDGFIYVADGQFMFPSEVEEPHFKKMELPTNLPQII